MRVCRTARKSNQWVFFYYFADSVGKSILKTRKKNPAGPLWLLKDLFSNQNHSMSKTGAAETQNVALSLCTRHNF